IEARRREEEAENLRRRREAEALAKSTPGAVAPAKTTAAKKSKGTSVPLNAKEIALSSSFSSNKGKLPWPVDNGFVSIPFGTYTVPGTSLKDVNSGLTITTPSANTAVKAAFDGEVTAVFNMGDGMAVVISHGKYRTVYNNLSDVSVSKGAAVRTGQSIGRTAADDEGGSGGKLDFFLMMDKQYINPSPWLRR
ncbi:MAG: peptidoglycan DD-metalloendopeptidase family protein, partial [Chitinophagaceae bacterium]